MTAPNKIAVRIGLITSAAIIVSWMIGQLAIYRYFKTEYYIALVAVVFLGVGIFLSNKKQAVDQTHMEDLLSELTQKELLILKQIAAGKSNKEIASDNFVELSTIKTHINNIYSKLGVNNRKEAIKAYVRIVR